MAADALAGARAKVERARTHLSGWDAVVAELHQAFAGAIAQEDDVAARRSRLRLVREPVIPNGFALLAGDVVHCLRCALDHVAFALCRASGKPISERQTKRIYFPIGDDAKNFEDRLESQLHALPHIDALAVIRKLQPYQGGGGHLLWVLDRLNNIDKHRLLLAVVLQQPAVDIGSLVTSGASFVRDGREIPWPTLPMYMNPADKSPLKIGDVLFDDILDVPRTQINLAFPIAISEPDVLPVQKFLDLLNRLGTHVESIIPQFEGWV